jgi:hypothetical protein
MHSAQFRQQLIYWLYAVSIAHILAGIALPLIIHLPLFDDYHRLLAAEFWSNTMPVEVRAQQVWWMSLFGATIQNVGIWMAALVRLGDLHRSRFAWLSLLLGVLVWAPQDMWISYTKGVQLHVWVDCFALLVMIPPLLLLAHIDKAQSNTKLKD